MVYSLCKYDNFTNHIISKFKKNIRTSIIHSEQSPHNIPMLNYIQIKRKKHVYKETNYALLENIIYLNAVHLQKDLQKEFDILLSLNKLVIIL
jgi:hypothetical protein